MTRKDLVSEWDDEPTKPIPDDVVRRMRNSARKTINVEVAGATLNIEVGAMDTRSKNEILQDLVSALQDEIASVK